MKMWIRAVQLRVETENGQLGADFQFARGLNIVEGPNSAGKSQVLQGVIWALGLERMFGPGAGVPLGSAFTDEATFPDGEASRVLRSHVTVEVENERGAAFSATRYVKHEQFARDLVRVYPGRYLTGDGMPDGSGQSKETRDYFLHSAGAARSAGGFHRFFAEFVGWNLPLVPRYTGSPAPLYIELLGPFLYVDQRAWNTAGPRRVTHLQIREPSRRAVEFLLGLAGPALQAERDRIELVLRDLRDDWTRTSASADALVSSVGGRLVGVPTWPKGMRDSGTTPSDLSSVELAVFKDGEWVSLESEELELGASVGDADEVVVATTADRDLLSDRLRTEQEQLSASLAAASVVEQEMSLEESQLSALDRRIGVLEEEQERYRDLRTLTRLGSNDASRQIITDNCPTCRQSLVNVESSALGPALGIEESASIVAAQLATLQSMRSQTLNAFSQTRNAVESLSVEARATRARIRGIQEELVSPLAYPSVSAITDRVTAQLRLAEINRVKESTSEAIARLQELATRAAELRRQLSDLTADTPQGDATRISALDGRMTEQMDTFGFRSYAASKVGVDEETLRPRRAGFDLDSDVSASDVVRVKIAYVNALREIANEVQSPHPGFLLLDEPRQHELDADNFRSALARLALSLEQGDQVIVTSAASVEELRDYLGGSDDVQLLIISDRTLMPI